MAADLEPFVELCRDAIEEAEANPDKPLGTYRQQAVDEIRDRAGDDRAVISAVAERLLEIAGVPKVTGGNGTSMRTVSRSTEADFFYVVANLLLDRPIR
jgi:hypothetical protein